MSSYYITSSEDNLFISMAEVMLANKYFSKNLIEFLSESEKNVFFSPISAHAALSVALQGAQGKTANAFASCINVPDALTAAVGYSVLINDLNRVRNVTLLIANKLYLSDEVLNKTITRHPFLEVQLMKSVNPIEAAAETINEWVKNQTQEEITITASELTDLKKLLPINSIYFKGEWKYKFNKEHTKITPFYVIGMGKVHVPMMHMKTCVYYRIDEDFNAQIFQLPYTNSNLKMTIIVPNKIDGINDVEKKLEKCNLCTITQRLRRTRVDIALPRFKFEQTIDLDGALTMLGLREIFENEPNFKGMIRGNEELFAQKAFIDVNEDGTEAAAVTAMQIQPTSGTAGPIPMQFINVMVDRPFIFYLSYMDSIVLFYGRVNRPDHEQLYSARKSWKKIYIPLSAVVISTIVYFLRPFVDFL